MKNKKVCLGLIVIAIIATLLGCIISYANNNETVYVNLTKLDTNGVGYGIGNPTVANDSGKPATNAYIWNITTYDSNNASAVSKQQRNFYCIKANYGDSWNANKDTIVAYNLSYDLQADRQKLLEKITGNNNSADSVVKALLSENGHYRELLWILDNSYIEGYTNKAEFLKQVGFKYDSDEEVYYYEAADGYDYSDLVTPSGYNEANLIKDSDIKAVQRAAIWYYTNYMADTTNDAIFNQKGKTDWLTITENGTTYHQLSDINKTEITNKGQYRNEQAMVIYNYLIDAAAKNASKYTSANNYTISSEVKANTTGLAQTNGKYKLSTTRVGSNYVIGPIKIDGNKANASAITIKVTNQAGSDISGYKFTNNSGTELQNQTIADLVGAGEFYITVPRTEIEKVNVKIEITQTSTKKTLFLKGTETTDAIKLAAEQPIVEVARTTTMKQNQMNLI